MQIQRMTASDGTWAANLKQRMAEERERELCLKYRRPLVVWSGTGVGRMRVIHPFVGISEFQGGDGLGGDWGT